MKKNHFLFSLGLLLSLFYASSCDNPYDQGRVLYEYHCANCHLSNGEGIAALIPPLNGADYLKENWIKLPCIIKNGLADTILVNGVEFNNPMAGIDELGAVEISNLVNFINHEWNNGNAPFITADGVREVLNSCD
jgi:mono/diheme cytochrome c family protein